MFCPKCDAEMIEWGGEDYCPSCDREEIIKRDEAIEQTMQYIRDTEQR